MLKLSWNTEKRFVKDLIASEINPRKISPEKKEALARSLEKFDLADIPVIDTKNNILSGKQRIEVMALIGREDQEIDVRVPNRKLTDEEFKEYMLIANTHAGEFDAELLELHFEEIEIEFDIPVYDIDKPEEKITIEEKPLQDDFNIETDIQIGDLFEIGNHRLLCGSSTDKDQVNILLNGNSPYLMVTDPPYGVNYDPTWRASQATKGFGAKLKAKGKVLNDDKADWTEAWALSPDKVAYVWHGGKHSGPVALSLENCDFEIRSQIIWVKPSLTFSRGDYHWQHEPCWYAVKKGFKGNWIGDRKQTTTWEIAGINPAGRSADKNDEAVGHGTQKPVECMARAIRNHSGDVHEPFAGSGSTIVACELLQRKCYAMELSPQFCQLIINRMIEAFPNVKVIKNGAPYSK